MKRLLLGDEAIALGAINAGLSGVYAYPGTPSTEITEFIQTNATARQRNIHSRWCTNEKTAMEAALGMSFMGKRALVCMKHVGLNVCADPFVNSGMTGVNGGVVVLVADDPSMHSSQDEQDSRFYGKFAMLPTFEPSSQQEAYDMMAAAFDYSEAQCLPVLMRVTTRMAHSRAVVQCADTPRQENALNHDAKAANWVLLPANARRRNDIVTAQQTRLEADADASPFNSYLSPAAVSAVSPAGPAAVPAVSPAAVPAASPAGPAAVPAASPAAVPAASPAGSPAVSPKPYPLGIIASGIAFNYVCEAFPGGCPFPVLKVSQYPLPKALVQRMAAESESIIVVEEGQPFIEEQVRGVLPTTTTIKGRLTGELPRTGELTPDSVAKALGAAPYKELQLDADTESVVAARPPQLCQGCGHRDVYTALNQVLAEYDNPRVFGDIGCYTLGFLPPYKAIHSCVDMGASITMAKGAADAGQWPAVAIIGDSTFTHSGMTGLLDAINENADITVIISDNLTTAMTGGQDSAGTNKFEAICRGLGVEPEHLHVVVPLPKNMPEITDIMRREINYHGVSVIIPRRECIQTFKRHAKAKKA